MDIPSFMLNKDVTGLLITLAGQSILISLIGLTVLKVLSKRSAPVRSLVCGATMIALGLTLVISIGFYMKGISWSQATLPFVTENNTKNIILLSPDRNTIASGEIRALPLNAPSQIPVEKNMAGPTPGISPYSAPFVLPAFFLINIAGLIWLTGILFQMMRLGYGIINIKKFRNSLQNCRNEYYDKMLQAVAGRFRKKRVPKLYSSSLIKSPVTIGIFNPVIIIPQKLSSIITENELKSILLHELAHIYHYDQVAGMIKRFVIAFHWWNPFVYPINGHHEQTREEVSDNYVLGELQPKVYSQCLMDLTKKVCLISGYPTAVGMAGRRFNLRKRVEQILSKKRPIAMNTKLYLKVVIFGTGLVFSFGVAGLHGKVQLNTETGKTEIFQVYVPVQQTEETQVSLKEKSVKQKQIYISDITVRDEKLHKPVQNKIGSQVETPVIVASNVSASIEKDIERQVMPQPSIETKKAVPAGYKKDLATAEKAKPLNETFIAAETHEASERKAHVQEVLKNRQETEKKETVPDKQNVNIIRDTEKNPFTSADYVFTGNKHFEKGEIEKAISAYSKAIDLDENNAVAYNNRGYLFYTIEENKKALKDFNRAIKISSDYKYAFYNRANTYSRIGKYQKAISDYDMVTNLDPMFELAYVNRGIAYISTLQHKKASQDFKKAEAINPKLASLVTKFDSLNKKSINLHRALSGRLNLSGKLVRSLEYRGIFPDLPVEDLSKIIKNANDILEIREPEFSDG